MTAENWKLFFSFFFFSKTISMMSRTVSSVTYPHSKSPGNFSTNRWHGFETFFFPHSLLVFYKPICYRQRPSSPSYALTVIRRRGGYSI